MYVEKYAMLKGFCVKKTCKPAIFMSACDPLLSLSSNKSEILCVRVCNCYYDCSDISMTKYLLCVMVMRLGNQTHCQGTRVNVVYHNMHRVNNVTHWHKNGYCIFFALAYLAYEDLASVDA